ncbi:unnamed protein product [Mytilus coruscus]|uniref:Uncharacterized protein n=1 Tax=Mytilus coruscus TaxID=42192 RepID=A0A6J8A6J6_MYTCO|nr:unnamed protein product [Mytilus coruscus]
MEIANTKSKFIKHINSIEKVLLRELSTIEKENNILIDEETTVLMKIVKEVEEAENALQFVADNGSENQLFTILKKQRRKQEDIIKMLEKIPPTSRITISLEEASHEIKAIKSIRSISIHYEIVESGRPGVCIKEQANAMQTASDQKNQTTTPTGSKFTMLKETLQLQLDPRDFVDKIKNMQN